MSLAEVQALRDAAMGSLSAQQTYADMDREGGTLVGERTVAAWRALGESTPWRIQAHERKADADEMGVVVVVSSWPVLVS